MDWLTIVVSAAVSLLSAGGIGWIITAKEDKKSKELDNTAKEFDIQEHKKDEIINDWKSLAAERKARADELTAALDESEQRYRDLLKTNSELRTKLDSRNTYCAVAELLKCSDIQCPKRVPPFSATVVQTNAAVDKLVNTITGDTNF